MPRSCASKSAQNNSKLRPSLNFLSSTLSVFVSLFLAVPLNAQTSTPCPTGPISYVFIDNHSIFDTTDPNLNSRFGWAYKIANSLHARTKRSVIERELLFNAGDCYDPYLLEETERMLRSYYFLAQVDVYGVSQPDGSYHVIVDTRDQWSTSLDLRMGFDGGFRLEGARLREMNLLGTGQEIGVFYRSREVTRDYGISYATPQLGGTRWDSRTSVGKTRAGTFVNERLGYPFLGEVGRWAALQSFSREDQFFDYVQDNNGNVQHILLPVREKAFEAGVGTRFGKRGNLTVLGAGLMYHELMYPGGPEMADANDFGDRVLLDSIRSEPLRAQSERLGSVRLAMVVGQRNIWWVKKRGYDNMRGEQDVPLGAEVTISVARSLAALERDNDLLGTVKLYAAFEGGSNSLFSGRLRVDARRDFQAPATSSEWEDVYGDAELLAYFRPPILPRHTFVFRGAGAAGWNTTTPFQLTLGGDRNLRGYRYDRFPGGRRVTFNFEDRFYIGWPLPDVADIGGTLFADIGHMWAGDVPYGVDSGWRRTIGLGLRGSFPPKSRTSFRLDFAAPMDGSLSFKKVIMILTAAEIIGLFASDATDVQITRSRNDGLSGELFRFRTR